MQKKIPITYCETCKKNTAIYLQNNKCVVCGNTKRYKTGKFYD